MEFKRLRTELAASRRQLDDQRQEALLAREAVRKAQHALVELERTEGPGSGAERTRLEQELTAAEDAVRQAEARRVRQLAEEDVLWGDFENFIDPRHELRRLEDGYPILLFPLRLETRFKTGTAGRLQLWVRVFPDTCLIDTFEPSLTEQEAVSARAFWTAVWRAGGDEELERAAWRDLVAAHGSGRAGWIVRQYTPRNLSDKPVKDRAEDVLLIILAAGPLPAAASIYWQLVWGAEGRAAAQQAAYMALEMAVGAEQARQIATVFRPVNFSDAPPPPLHRADVNVKVAVLQLPPVEDLKTRRRAWSSAPRVDLLPERFVLVAYPKSGEPRVEISRPVRAPLPVGPDPNAPRQDDTLEIPDELAWMFDDFERALDVGMAFRFDLEPPQAEDGFERVIVLGVRMAEAPQTAQQSLERLLEHHLYSRPGLEILPQGTPTNNTEKGGAGYSFRDDPEATFDIFFGQRARYEPQGDPRRRCDGQWLAELLGLPHDLVRRFPHADGSDQSEARAMQTALWPGTLGYMMRTQLAPVFSPQTIAKTRAFFTRYVSGRGPLPALRIGAQPYGILPTAAFDRIDGFGPGEEEDFLTRLHAVLRRVTEDWKPLVEQISHLGQRGDDPYQDLLDVLGLHPTSVEYHPLHAESLEHKFHELAFMEAQGKGPSGLLRSLFKRARAGLGSFLGSRYDAPPYSPASSGLLARFPAANLLTLLRGFGYTGEEEPDLLNKVFKSRQTPLDGPLIDDRPLSESEPIRNYAGSRNYVEWLVGAARTSIERLQEERGFDGDEKPTALLYLLLRHALQLGFHAAALRLLPEPVEPLPREPPAVHVRETGFEVQHSESFYEALFRDAGPIVDPPGPSPVEPGARHAAPTPAAPRPHVLLGDHIARGLDTIDAELREQVVALERLSQVPTARLERLLAEHVDVCSYRLDAWKTGLLACRLEHLRRSEKPRERAGLFLGAYGWLEPLRPERKDLKEAELPRDLSERVNPGKPSPLMSDPANEGLIHAPSLNHATTAAVLRNGYLANDGRLAVHLTSRRVRLALGILEGMRNGQSSGALLGYRFERHVHDHGRPEAQALVYALRRAFPLAADQIEKTRSEEGEPRESIAAMNVVDGGKLLEHAESGQRYPGDQEEAIRNALAHIRDVNDAVADLALAEGVHQAVLGNPDRSAAMLDAFAKGGRPPEPEVIRTPRSGTALTLRTAIHFAPPPSGDAKSAIPPTPLAEAEPAVNAWLSGRLPAAKDVGCWVGFTTRDADRESEVFLTQEHLGLQPIDLIYRAEAGVDSSLSDLDDRILTHLHQNYDPRHDHPITIRYTKRKEGKVNWFELQALLRGLRVLVKASRPLRPTDLIRAHDAGAEDPVDDEPATVFLPRKCVLDDLQDSLSGELERLAAADDLPVDDLLENFVATVGRLAAYRLPQTGTGFAYAWRTETYTALTRKVAERVKIWDGRLARFRERLVEHDNLPAATPEPERTALLQAAEVLISNRLTTPVPAPAAYRDALDAKQAAFETKRDALRELVDVPRATLAQLLQDAEAQIAPGDLPPLSDFDPQPLDFDAQHAEIDRFRVELANAVARLRDEVDGRVRQVKALLGGHDAASAVDRVRLLQEAARVLFGEDFQMVPQITLPAAAAEELGKAWQHSDSGGLTRHLTEDHDFPVDDWLHGVARVREKMRHWESVVLLGEALGATQPCELTPLQLPHGPDAPWLALQIPEEIERDHLLYTAHFAKPFVKTEPVCGLLVDEWTEVIPGGEETTGVAFHFDRPNSEPPQAWLLALPAARHGAWSWDDLLASVNETLDAAKMRALEPAHLEKTAYAGFLPATMSAYTFPEISISNNLLRNRQIYERFGTE